VDALIAGKLPVFSFGANPCGPTKRVAGRVNWPIAVGGVAVNPGDLVVGDADGVVVIERARVPEILRLAHKKVAEETKRLTSLRSGGELVPGWLAPALRDADIVTEQQTA